MSECTHTPALHVNIIVHTLNTLWGFTAGRKIHGGTRHYAVLPLSFAVKPLKCAEGVRYDLLPCHDCQNDPKSFEIRGKSMSN